MFYKAKTETTSDFLKSQFKEQYMFIHIAIIERYLFSNTILNKRTCTSDLRKLLQINMTFQKSKLEIQFEVKPNQTWCIWKILFRFALNIKEPVTVERCKQANKNIYKIPTQIQVNTIYTMYYRSFWSAFLFQITVNVCFIIQDDAGIIKITQTNPDPSRFFVDAVSFEVCIW